MFMFTDRCGKANMMEVLLEEDGQEIAITESSLGDVTKTKYVPVNMQSVETFDQFHAH